MDVQLYRDIRDSKESYWEDVEQREQYDWWVRTR